jgi:hypothetical protein
MSLLQHSALQRSLSFFMALYYVLDERYANLALKICDCNGTALPIL